MRFNAAIAAAILAFAGPSFAQVEDAEAAPSSVAERPLFTPTTILAPFLEQFTDDWDTRWTPSHAKKEDSKSEEDWAYVGEWVQEEAIVFPGIAGDKGLVVKNPAAHHAISAKFPKKIDNKGKTLVVQYEVKLQNGLECGGAYLKLLQDNKKLHAEEFSNTSPYVIMFGPDKCGATNKVHFIFKHKNPKTGEYEEKHLKSPPAAKTSKLTTLYTLIVKPDNTFEMLIDGSSAKNGSLLEDFSPSVNPVKEIDDPKDTKPKTWVDEARIADPEAEKPEDWDEEAPFEIVDEDATKPEDWLEDEPISIPDPEAEKPEDWDDEEDGDWIPPTVSNSKCEEASGCGPWEKPMIKNPEYRGKWSAPFIDNPAYEGVWAPRKIANPDYFEDKTPANFEPMGAIGFEIWTMQADILFDNIYIGHSIEDAAAFRSETYDVKRPIEDAEDAKSKPVPDSKPSSPLDLSFTEDPVTYIKEKLDLFITLAKKDPVEAIKFMPEVAGAIGGGIVLVLAILIGVLGAGSAAAPSKEKIKKTAQKAKDQVLDTKDQAVEPSSPLDLSFTEDPVTYIKEKLDLFITLAKKDPVEAIKFMPEVAGAIGGGIVLVLAILVGVLGAGSAAAPSKEKIKKTAQEAKDQVLDTKDQAVDATVSGVEQSKTEVNKRTTRSSAGSE